jgi:hypothetical protein
MFRKTTTIATLAAAGVTLLPGAAQADGVQAALKLEAQAVVNSDKAVDLAKENARKAGALVKRSEAQMKKAYTLTVEAGKEAHAKFSAAAEAQGENLADVVERSRGELKRKAAEALAQSGEMAAKLDSESAAVGDDQASIAAQIGVVLDGQRLQDDTREALEGARTKLEEGARYDVSYEKSVGDDSSPVQVSVAAQAHAVVGQGGRR